MSLSVRLAHRFGNFALDVAFDAPPGITVVFGRSGSGKSTVINAVAGLLRPDDGRISLDGTVLLDTATGRAIPPYRRGLGVIFQEDRLFPHLTVRQNLGFARWFARGGADDAMADRIIAMLGIGHLLDRRPRGLSGGEKQRVAIGRTLLAGPRMILADEPLSSLDAARKAEILPYFERLRDELGIPIIYVSHAADEVARLATTVIAMEDGRVSNQGPAAEVLGDPENPPGEIKPAGADFEGTILARHSDGLTEIETGGVRLFVPCAGGAIGARVQVCIPARDVMLCLEAPEGISALNTVQATVERVEAKIGPDATIRLQSRAGPLLAQIAQRSIDRLGIVPGKTVHAVIRQVAVVSADPRHRTGKCAASPSHG